MTTLQQSGMIQAKATLTKGAAFGDTPPVGVAIFFKAIWTIHDTK